MPATDPREPASESGKTVNATHAAHGISYGPSFETSVSNCPSTQRTPALYASDYIEKPGVARGNLAVSTTRPDGDTEYMKKYPNHVTHSLIRNLARK